MFFRKAKNLLLRLNYFIKQKDVAEKKENAGAMHY